MSQSDPIVIQDGYSFAVDDVLWYIQGTFHAARVRSLPSSYNGFVTGEPMVCVLFGTEEVVEVRDLDQVVPWSYRDSSSEVAANAFAAGVRAAAGSRPELRAGDKIGVYDPTQVIHSSRWREVTVAQIHKSDDPLNLEYSPDMSNFNYPLVLPEVPYVLDRAKQITLLPDTTETMYHFWLRESIYFGPVDSWMGAVQSGVRAHVTKQVQEDHTGMLARLVNPALVDAAVVDAVRTKLCVSKNVW